MKKKILKDNEKLFNELKIGSLVKTIRPICKVNINSILPNGTIGIVLNKRSYQNEKFYIDVLYNEEYTVWHLYLIDPFFSKIA